MEKIRLGKTDLMVTRLGFGGIPIQRLSEEDAITVVRKCVELGITFLDTANAYTTSEERIGKAIAGKRQEFIIATKSGARDRENIEKHLNLSLEHLQTDYIDLYQFHGVSTFEHLKTVMDPKGPRAVVEDAKKAGKIRHIGITSHSMDVAKEAVKTDQFETLMFPFNFITCEPAEELLPLCREHDVGFIDMKPMGGGMLDNATVAFKYLLQFPDIVYIPGIEQTWEIEEIAGIVQGSGQMTPEEEAEMQRLCEELGTRFCRRCDYCQPCPQEIPISTVMNSASFAKRLPPQRIFSGWISEGMERAATCTDCGECEEKCPYHLPIREIIAERSQWYQEAKKQYQEQIA
ncbi:MAG TPA: aldo/keto reductase [Dehalococcoidia bacterium]|nr:aldo/keto reductase [Dehalococcoidia bacterium]